MADLLFCNPAARCATPMRQMLTLLLWMGACAIGLSLVPNASAQTTTTTTTATPTAIAFTPAETAYIQQSSGITMCVDPDWAPFERITPEGQHEGIAADLIQQVAQRVGLQIALYPTASWDDSLV